MTQTSIDRSFMKRALRLAARGVGTTHPNPMVGAVLVRGGSVVGEGWHRLPGKPHAEILAIDRAGSRTRGATLYVNLEPCSHYGRTPPCTDRIIQAGISRLVAGCRDPNPDVNGKGFEILRRAGIEVSEGLLGEESHEINRAFFYYVANALPYVTLKTALTLDGRIATSGGQSRWITGKESRKAAHRLRSRADAVLVGVGTVLADDPELTVRAVRSKVQPWRIVLDPSLKTPFTAKVVARGEDGRTMIVVDEKVAEKRAKAFNNMGIRLVKLPIANGLFSWPSLGRRLVEKGIIHLMVEGGGKTAAWFVKEDAICRIEAFIAPILVGSEGISAMGPLALEALGDAPRFDIVRCRRVGGDVRITADRRGEKAGNRR